MTRAPAAAQTPNSQRAARDRRSPEINCRADRGNSVGRENVAVNTLLLLLLLLSYAHNVVFVKRTNPVSKMTDNRKLAPGKPEGAVDTCIIGIYTRVWYKRYPCTLNRYNNIWLYK